MQQLNTKNYACYCMKLFVIIGVCMFGAKLAVEVIADATTNALQELKKQQEVIHAQEACMMQEIIEGTKRSDIKLTVTVDGKGSCRVQY